MNASEMEKTQLKGDLTKAQGDLERLNSKVSGLEQSLATSKEIGATTQSTLEVRSACCV